MRQGTLRINWRIISLAVAAMGFCDTGAAEGGDTAQGHERPSIGLVLSGGGARGAAHVGVIKVLEQLRVPIDFIAGTSMGAVVGGLYASGLSAEELENAIVGSDWPELFDDRPPRAERSFRRKTDDRNFLVNFDLGVKDGRLVVPPGLVQGQKLMLALRRLSLPVATVRDFDNLPIPFRAVAADIQTGDLVVLRQGDLALAMRASMSAPGVFRPVNIDGRVLVDGGIASNLPISVAKELGADLLIVVDVGFPLLEVDELKSAVAITSQMLTILIQAQSRQQRALMQPADVLIQPDLERFGSQQFERAVEALELGEQAALAVSSRLLELSVSENRYAAFRAALATRQRAVPVIRQLDVHNESRLSTRLIASRISDQFKKPLDVSLLEADLARVYGFDTFESVDYRIEGSGDDTRLIVEGKEKSWGPNFVRFGVNIEEDFDGTSDYNVAARCTLTELNRLGGEIRLDTQIGSNTRIGAEFFQPLDYGGRWFVNPALEIQQLVTPQFANGDRVATFRTREAVAELAAGRQLGNWGEVRVAVSRGYGDARIATGDPRFGRSNSNFAGSIASFSYDTIDRMAIPVSGAAFSAAYLDSMTELGAELDFRAASMFYLKPQTWGRNTLLHWWNVGKTLEAPPTSVTPFSLGGLFSLSGYSRQQLSGRHTAIGRLLYYRRLSDRAVGPFDTTLYLGASIEAGNVWQSTRDIRADNVLTAGSLFVVLDTFVGPIYLAYGEAEGGRHSYYIYLGQTF